MKTANPRYLARLLPGLALAALAIPTASAQSLEQVVTRYLQARGGLARLRAVQTLRMTGRLALPGVVAPFTLELKRPGRMRAEFAYQGLRGVRAYDGQKGWALPAIPGRERPEPLSPDELEEAREQADIDLSPLVDYQAKGHQVELVGRERVEGKEAFRLKVVLREGTVRTLYLDAKSCLPIRAEDTRPLDGAPTEFVTETGDYRPVDGIQFAHSLEIGPKGHAERQRITFDRIEVNVPLDDARFQKPSP
ncbi:MAG TPA: hypothetical protein VN375_14790 [Vicinamibacteria bacterium]|nr:hypothetical protein [Vicinamibacteria bacterium]